MSGIDVATVLRTAMDAMRHPGRIRVVEGGTPPAPLSVAGGTLLLALCDQATPVHLAGPFNAPRVREWLDHHCGSPLVAAHAAEVAIGTWQDFQPLDRFNAGTRQAPGNSATLIVECAALEETGVRMRVPGLARAAHLPLPEPEFFRLNAARSPLGLDFFLAAGNRAASVPRTLQIFEKV